MECDYIYKSLSTDSIKMHLKVSNSSLNIKDINEVLDILAYNDYVVKKTSTKGLIYYSKKKGITLVDDINYDGRFNKVKKKALKNCQKMILAQKKEKIKKRKSKRLQKKKKSKKQNEKDADEKQECNKTKETKKQENKKSRKERLKNRKSK